MLFISICYSVILCRCILCNTLHLYNTVLYSVPLLTTLQYSWLPWTEIKQSASQRSAEQSSALVRTTVHCSILQLILLEIVSHDDGEDDLGQLNEDDQPAKVWNIPGWDELGWKTYDPNSIPTFCHPEPRPTTPIVLVDISSYSYLK